MKKLFSIFFAVMILLSGMHLSIATHLCGGEISQVKLSFTHENATCGVCEKEQAPSGTTNVSNEGCCKDQMSFYAVDNNYNPSTTQINDTVKNLLQVFDIAKVIGIQSLHSKFTSNTYVQPPGNYIASAVSLPYICVFRI